MIGRPPVTFIARNASAAPFLAAAASRYFQKLLYSPAVLTETDLALNQTVTVVLSEVYLAACFLPGCLRKLPAEQMQMGEARPAFSPPSFPHEGYFRFQDQDSHSFASRKEMSNPFPSQQGGSGRWQGWRLR